MDATAVADGQNMFLFSLLSPIHEISPFVIANISCLPIKIKQINKWMDAIGKVRYLVQV